MVSERDLFRVSGPVHLTFVNWNCPHQQRSVVASLVQGVYVLEHDRQRDRHGREARAPDWWKNFHFELIHTLIDVDDLSIFGAIYEFRPPDDIQNLSNGSAPKFVIAFRGTIIKKSSLCRDFRLNLRLIINSLDQAHCFQIAMEAVWNLVSAFGSDKVWVAGHSLGSAIATLAGKNMVKRGINLITFLFNPPFVSVPPVRIANKNKKRGIRIAKSFIKAGLAVAVKGRKESEDHFAMLSSWVPNLFVNPADHICAEYIGYFEHRRKMENIGAGYYIERLASQNTVKDLISSALGKESEPLHLIPSARLTVNMRPSMGFKQAHGLNQWWRPDLNFQFKEYIYT